MKVLKKAVIKEADNLEIVSTGDGVAGAECEAGRELLRRRRGGGGFHRLAVRYRA